MCQERKNQNLEHQVRTIYTDSNFQRMVHGMPEKYIESDSQLTKSEKNITRACSSCGGEMKPSKKVIENSLTKFTKRIKKPSNVRLGSCVLGVH